MQVIKFRQFYQGKFHYWGYTEKGVFISPMATAEAQGIESQQFTGLLDKNGKEIYEGDIVECPVEDRPYSSKKKIRQATGVVIWDKGFNHSKETIKLNPILKENPSFFNQNPCFGVNIIEKEYKYWGFSWSHFHDCKIIGNKYQNPELLN